MKKINLNKFIKQGSITVEAAFVLPFVVFAISALIYLALYLHDISLIQAAVDQSLHKSGLSVKHDADVATGEIAYENINDRGVFYLAFGDTSAEEKKLYTYLQQRLSEGLLLSRITSLKTEVGKFSLSVDVEAETKISLPGFNNLFKKYQTTIVKGEYPVHDPAETIRRIEVILDTGSSIKGVDKIKEKLEKFFGKD